jgi:hypothetical protein
MAFGKNANQMQERALRVLLGLQPLTTTAYLLRVLPAILEMPAGRFDRLITSDLAIVF